MRISVFGLGYVGSVTAACLAADGHTVLGVEPNPVKVDLINGGKSPVVEPEIAEIIDQVVRAGSLRACAEARGAVKETELSLVCVGTPSQSNGKLDLRFLRRVSEEIGTCLREKQGFHVVVIRSTVLPGTIRETVIPILEAASGKRAGVEFGVCCNPEFLREGSAVRDFRKPPKTVIGERDRRSGDLVAGLYERIEAPLFRTPVEVAEMVKYTDNSWHALKVGFANEIGNICKALGVDSHRVMEIFCQDTVLNLSSCYLKPGFAFGGSCLPKDLRALTYQARAMDVDAPILDAVLRSNSAQVQRGVAMVTAHGRKKVGVLGFSFKAGTDDLRESPVVEVIERLLGKGYDLKLYDRNVNLARLTGANRDYILNMLPHISRLMVDTAGEVLEHGEIILVGNGDPLFHDIPDRLTKQQTLIDLVRISEDRTTGGNYEGICW